MGKGMMGVGGSMGGSCGGDDYYNAVADDLVYFDDSTMAGDCYSYEVVCSGAVLGLMSV
jgi:hypothetical protein